MRQEYNGIPAWVIEQAIEVRDSGSTNMVLRSGVLEVAEEMELTELVEWIEDLPRKSQRYYVLLTSISDYLADIDSEVIDLEK